MRNWKPIFIENSRIPVWLSKLSPIEIGAITLGLLVISRDEMSEVTKNHETIHFQQYLELFFIGFIPLYLWDWAWGLWYHRKGNIAYFSIRAEQEAYCNHEDMTYNQTRKRYAWIRDYKVKSPPYIDQIKGDNNNV